MRLIGEKAALIAVVAARSRHLTQAAIGLKSNFQLDAFGAKPPEIFFLTW
ncbi:MULTISPECIES: hypothetical protein [unclassified Wenzhouxiangella]|nr:MULTISPECIES: hypothetical protein [unclassified Wenzhouxiangella]